MALPVHPVLRISRRLPRGSSSPVVVETPAGVFVAKLRGAAQGIPPLLAEILVGELATLLGLSVPERAIVTLAPDTPTEDRNDELADLIARSHGDNVGLRFLPGATDLRPDELGRVDEDSAARILWLDGLVSNPDRTARNPNVLLWHGRPWLIDHGACLAFHHDWARVTEDSPREAWFDPAGHLFHAHRDAARRVDAECAAVLGRDVLARAADALPDSLLRAAFPRDAPARSRAVYAAYLWKRLKAPRSFP